MNTYKTIRLIPWGLALLGLSLWSAEVTIRARGRVLDYQNKPVAGLEVLFQRTGDQRIFSAQTGFDGGYAFPALPEGQYRVRVRGGGFPEQTLEIKISKHPEQKETVGLPDIRMPPLASDTVPASLGKEFDGVMERMKKGDFTGAVPVLEQLAKRRPLDADILFILGVAYNHENRYAEALSVLKRATEIRLNFAGAHYEMGLAYHSLNQPKPARQAYEMALELDPEKPEVRYNLGLVLVQLNEPRQALTQFDWILKVKPNDVDSLEMAARCHIQMGQYPPAVELLEQALRQSLSPEKRKALTILVTVLKERSKPR